MSLFQKSVEQKYLIELDSKLIDSKYLEFQRYFGNPVIQDNIRNSKEEQFQEGFLRELFVKILGYTLNPDPDFNLTTELKNIANNKKADGAVLRGTDALAVIELKSTSTTNLDLVETQAFGYKNHNPKCVYIITSNFEKIRFYIQNAVEFIEFNLFSLTRDQFSLLWLCLAKENILSDVALRIKIASVLKEENITKELYTDYSNFRNDLFNNLVKDNPDQDILLLFRKTQKLLDRFLFILFAEDRQLLPPNSISEILKQWKSLKDELDAYVPLYDRFKKYFGYLNTGHKGKVHDIYAYNGGLFIEDKLLDKIDINDDLLYKHTLRLSSYNFNSEVDVNILGHIFEHSLNEIENVQAEISGINVERQKTKRKKEGIFYTPKYITKYIVENSVGKLCATKKNEIQFIDEEFSVDKKRTTKAKHLLLEKLKKYRSWLLQITICDPACGSGAFLNQALDFLIMEHRYIDELQAKIFGDTLILSDIENSILENNLFGVDLNEESVEIAKLSLWLRTAQPNRKLNDLSNNIKCGNSLIDVSEVAGEKAFNWNNAFPQIFKKGGFDIIIGNPPYLRVQGLRGNLEKESVYFEGNFKSATGRFDIYVLFIEKGFSLLNNEGILSYILPHKFINSDFGKGIREYLYRNKAINKIVHFGSEMVFIEASTYTCILNLSHNNTQFQFKQIKPLEIQGPFEFDNIPFDLLKNTNRWSIQSASSNIILEKLKHQPCILKDIFQFISQGVVSVGDDIFLMQGRFVDDKFIGYSEKTKSEITLEKDIVKPILKGEDVKKYQPLFNNYYVIYPHYEKDGKTLPIEEDELKNKYPLTYQYFKPYKEELIEKKIRYKTNPRCWYSLHRSREISLFERIKIITPEISLGTNMTFDEENFYHNTKCYSLILKDEYILNYKLILAILNSPVLWYFLLNTGYVLRGGFFTFKTKYLEPFPIPNLLKIDDQIYNDKVDLILSLNKEFYLISEKFQKMIQRKFTLDNISGKLQSWYLLPYKEFIEELARKKVKLTLSEEAEWENYHLQEANLALDLKSKIKAIDYEISQLVYALYELTDQEIKIIEGI